MASYNATYTINGTVQPAQLSLLNEKAAIQLFTPEGERTVYWFYHEVKQAENNRTLFTYTMYPPQTLEVPDTLLADAFATQLHQSKKTVLKQRNQTALAIITACVAVIAVVYFFILPWAATALAARVPVAYEKSLGDEMFQSMKQDFNIDEKRSAYTTAFFDAMHIPSAYNIKITVVKSNVANAFALPGGHIIVYGKLLNSLSAYPQLAALLAHEFVHIQNRHSLKMLFRQASATLILSALIGDAGALGSVVLNSANNLKSLSYSRSLESEADADGLALLTERNIDSRGFIQLFRILQNEPDTEAPEWISSHPQLKKRIKNMQQNAALQQQRAVPDSTLHQLFLKIKTAD